VDMLATGTAATAVMGTSAALTGATGSIAVVPGVPGGIPKMAAANVTVAVALKGAKATTGKH
jgi:hypothetical protein